MFVPGCHRCKLSGVLHHSVHRGGLCCPHLPHLHLRSPGEALPPGRSLPLQCTQRSGQTHAGIVSNRFPREFNCMFRFSLFIVFFCALFFHPCVQFPSCRASHSLRLSLCVAVGVQSLIIPVIKPWSCGVRETSQPQLYPGPTLLSR